MPELFPNINASANAADPVPIAVHSIAAVRRADLIAEPIADPVDTGADTQCARRAILERRMRSGERGVDAGETQDYDDERVVKQQHGS